MTRRLLSLWLPNGPVPQGKVSAAAPAEPGQGADRSGAVVPAIFSADRDRPAGWGADRYYRLRASVRRRGRVAVACRKPFARVALTAIAGTAAAAWGLARYRRVPGSEDLDPLPLAALRLERPLTIRKLRRVGYSPDRRVAALCRRAELTAGLWGRAGVPAGFGLRRRRRRHGAFIHCSRRIGGRLNTMPSRFSQPRNCRRALLRLAPKALRPADGEAGRKGLRNCRRDFTGLIPSARNFCCALPPRHRMTMPISAGCWSKNWRGLIRVLAIEALSLTAVVTEPRLAGAA